MASQKRPAQQSATVNTVPIKEIALIILVMVVLAGGAASFALLG